MERGALRRGGGPVVTPGHMKRGGKGVVFLAAAHPLLSGGAQIRTNELRLAS